MIKILILTAVLSLGLILGCGSSKIIAEKNSGEKEVQRPPAQSKKIPPGQCMIAGTVISVDSTLDKYSSKDPCSINPCKAVVRVDSIIGYGSSFPPLQKRTSIDLYFYFTLGPTDKNLFPNLKEFYPGLKTGDTFTGNIIVRHTMNSNSKLKQFAIYGYQRIN